MWLIEVHQDGARMYRWRLWGADGRPACVSPGAYAALSNAERLALRFTDAARDLDYEVVRHDGAGYGWKALDGEGRAVAESARTFESRAGAADDADRVRRFAGMARIP